MKPEALRPARVVDPHERLVPEVAVRIAGAEVRARRVERAAELAEAPRDERRLTRALQKAHVTLPNPNMRVLLLRPGSVVESTTSRIGRGGQPRGGTNGSRGGAPLTAGSRVGTTAPLSGKVASAARSGATPSGVLNAV